jgi:hypothetical protein
MNLVSTEYETIGVIARVQKFAGDYDSPSGFFTCLPASQPNFVQNDKRRSLLNAFCVKSLY